MSAHERSPKFTREALTRLSIGELTELCFQRQFPNYSFDEVRPMGFVPAGAALTLENVQDIRPHRRELWPLRSRYDAAGSIGKLMMRGRMRAIEVAATVPTGAVPVFEGSRQFGGDRSKGRQLATEGAAYESFIVRDRVLLGVVPEQGPQTLPGTRETVYTHTDSAPAGPTIYGAGRDASIDIVRTRRIAEPGVGPSTYTYPISAERGEYLYDEEIRGLLIEWGELGQTSRG